MPKQPKSVLKPLRANTHVMVSTAFARDWSISPVARAVYLDLLSRTEVAGLTAELVCQFTGLDEKAVQEVIRELNAAGYIANVEDQ